MHNQYLTINFAIDKLYMAKKINPPIVTGKIEPVYFYDRVQKIVKFVPTVTPYSKTVSNDSIFRKILSNKPYLIKTLLQTQIKVYSVYR